MSDKPSYLNFDKSDYAWKADIDYRAHPEKYRIGKGEQGVLICEPYKTEIGAFWRFKNEEIAQASSEKIFHLFMSYLNREDFVGADMARKFLQMGYTRARRYANYKGGQKYDKDSNYEIKERGTGDPEKAISANVFYKKWREAEENEKYASLKKAWKAKFG